MRLRNYTYFNAMFLVVLSNKLYYDRNITHKMKKKEKRLYFKLNPEVFRALS